MKITLNTIKYFKYKTTVKNVDNPFNQNQTYKNDFIFPNSNFYGTLSFGAKRCSPANFKIKEIKNLRCPVCSKIMLNEAQQNQFIACVSSKKGAELKEALEFWEDERNITGDFENGQKRSLYRIQEQKIVDILKNLAVQYPDLNLRELVAHQAQPYLENLMKAQLEIVKELEDYIQKNVSSDNELVELKKIIEAQKKSILGQGGEFSRKGFIYALSDTVSDPWVQNDILDIAFKLPNSQNDINSFFVKYSKENKSSRAIAQRLISKTNPTTEHLKPKSKGGADAVQNYICDCSDCNLRRDATSFFEWQKTIENFEQNLQNYLEDVQRALDDKILSSEFDNYAPNVIETIKTLSKGTINLKIPDSKNQSTLQHVILKRKRIIEEYRIQVNELIRRKKEKRKEISDLEAVPHFRNIVLYSTITKDIMELDNTIKTLEEKISSSCDEEDKSALSAELKSKQEEKALILNKKNIIEKAINKLLEIDKPIQSTKTKLLRMQDTQNLIDKYQKKIEKKMVLTQELAEIKEKTDYYNQRCAYLESHGLLDEKAYNEYLKALCLKEKAQEMLSKFTPSKKPKQEEEIILIAKNAIETRLKILNEEEGIEFFLNKEEIKLLKKREKEILTFLEKNKNPEQDLENLTAEFQNVSQGKTISEVIADLSSLEKQRDNLRKIMNIKLLRDELSFLDDTIAYNSRIINYLREHYKTMTNEEFKQKIDSLYLKEIKN